MQQSMPVTELTFMELLFSQQHFINNLNSEFHENAVKDSVTDTKSQIDTQTNMVSKSFFFKHRKDLKTAVKKTSKMKLFCDMTYYLLHEN
jgi:hypothetical protein